MAHNTHSMPEATDAHALDRLAKLASKASKRDRRRARRRCGLHRHEYNRNQRRRANHDNA